MSDIVIAVILGIVEGLTEFIPVSSTGHLIVAGRLLDFTGDRAETFEVVIQVGAILAVMVLYRDRIASMISLGRGSGVQGRSGLILLVLTSLPAVVLGAALHGTITERLFSPTIVAIGWGLGGVALIAVERFAPQPKTLKLDAITPRQALAIGLFQTLALWPGASRAASTIGGAMVLGIDRRTAAEYSFLAALPVIIGAATLQLVQNADQLSAEDFPLFITGLVVAFGTAWVAVRFFLGLLARWSLAPYGWYRIAAAAVLLLAIWAGWLE